MNDLRERLLKTVVKALTKEIENCVDNGKLSQDILDSDDGIWVDTDESDYSIQIWLDWASEPVSVNATAFPLILTDKGYLQEDTTSTEINIMGEK
jgi:hypothetical protein